MNVRLSQLGIQLKITLLRAPDVFLALLRRHHICQPHLFLASHSSRSTSSGHPYVHEGGGGGLDWTEMAIWVSERWHSFRCGLGLYGNIF